MKTQEKHFHRNTLINTRNTLINTGNTLVNTRNTVINTRNTVINTRNTHLYQNTLENARKTPPPKHTYKHKKHTYKDKKTWKQSEWNDFICSKMKFLKMINFYDRMKWVFYLQNAVQFLSFYTFCCEISQDKQMYFQIAICVYSL